MAGKVGDEQEWRGEAWADEAVELAGEFGYPVVLKLNSNTITHKTDVGGVRLNLQNADMVASAYDDMLRHVRALRPDARIEGEVGCAPGRTVSE
jgi:acetyltransferase